MIKPIATIYGDTIDTFTNCIVQYGKGAKTWKVINNDSNLVMAVYPREIVSKIEFDFYEDDETTA